MAIVHDTEGSRLAQPARRAPATQPHTRVSGLLGVVTAALLIAVIIGAQVDRDGRVGERLLAGGAAAAITGLGYVATRVRTTRQAEPTQEYWDGYARCAVDILGERVSRQGRGSGRRHRSTVR
jgi:hypothetical protein